MPGRGARLPPLLLSLAAAAGCTPPASPPPEARTDVTRQRFESAESVLVDFTVEGTVSSATDDPASVRAAVETQLFYTVGILNADRSVGRFGDLVVDAASAVPDGARFAVTYRARLPVAWGAGTPPPTYDFTLPARVESDAQVAFATKYGSTCVAEEFTAVDASAMFLHYRPTRAGCLLDPLDVITAKATVTPSAENTSGRYPEYHRIWEDGTLQVVALFSREFDTPPPATADGGVLAFADYLARVDALLAERQPDASKRTSETAATRGLRAAELPDGRRVRVDVALVAPDLASEDAAFDAFYDARTEAADLVVYGGHAGRGGNVRTLATKGRFTPGHYLLLVLNGCDTLAYVDETLAARRAQVNPDDPSGTRHLDVVTNVMAGYFGTTADTAMIFLHGALGARDAGSTPRTYRALLDQVDPRQVITVTGEEDNVFTPSLFGAETAPPPVGVEPLPAVDDGASDEDEDLEAREPARTRDGCHATPTPPRVAPGGVLLTAFVLGSRRLRRRRAIQR